jgi:hypothetical protein
MPRLGSKCAVRLSGAANRGTKPPGGDDRIWIIALVTTRRRRMAAVAATVVRANRRDA